MEPAETVLPIRGHRDEPVPNRFLRQPAETDHLAIFLPGLGYTCDMPLFYYAQNLLTDLGADLLRVEYAYGRRPDFPTLPEAERLGWLLADATAAFRAALAQRPYRRLTLVGKSLGTLAMGHLLTTEDPPSDGTAAVWLTPLLRDERLIRQIRRCPGRSLFVIGSDDDHYDPALLDDLRAATGAEAVVVDGADHGVDIVRDVPSSVQAVKKVVRALQRFFLG